MVNKEIVYKQLSDLEESLKRIEKMDFTFDMISGDEDIQDLLDRRIQKAIESCIGMAAHIVAERGWKRSENTRSLFEILEKHEIISKELSKKMSGAVGFRNIVVHKYTDIDYNLAYSDLDEKMSDIKSFAKVVKSFISSG